MIARLIFVFSFLLLFATQLRAAECLSVFPSGLTSSAAADAQLINFPPNFSFAMLTNNTVLPRGDNLYLNSSLGNKANIFVGPVTPAETTARLFIRNAVRWQNIKINESGSPEDLIIVIDGNLQITGGQTNINAIIYVKGSIFVSGNPNIRGSVTSVGGSANFGVSYDASYINNADFNGMCDGVSSVSLLADFHFDECEYTGSAFEVIDETGNYPASSFGGLDTTELGKIERAADLSDYNHHIATNIPLPAAFSLSAWFKKPTANTDRSYFVLASTDAGNGLYDDLFFVDRDNGWRWGVYNKYVGVTLGTYSMNALDDNWHHLAVVSSGTTNQLYIDGVYIESVETPFGVASGTLAYIGTSKAQPSGSDADSFRSPIDEFMLFDGALTAAQVSDIYANQSVGNNYDGSARAPANCNSLVHYSLEALSWSGATDEVIDENGNLHGQSFNGATTATLNSAISGNPGTCGYGHFDGINDYIEIADDPLLDLEKELTVTAWVNIDSLPSSGLKTIISKDENYEFHVNSSGEIFWWWSTHSFSTTGFSITPGTWYHIAVTYRSGEQFIYVNGVERASRTHTGNLILNNDAFQIGQDQGYSGRYFNGLIDEVKIYQRALTPSEIVSVYNETHACSATIDHFQIVHDGQGLTCQAEDITIKACANTDCSILNSTPTDVQLSVGGVFNQTVTVIGEAQTSFSHTTAETVALSLDQAYQCLNGASTSCDIVFADTGFQFLSGGIAGIPTQLSGKPSDTGYNSSTLELQAITTSPITGACEAALVNAVDIEFSATCTNPTTCAGQQVTINNLVTDTVIETIDNAAIATYSPTVSLNFGDANDSTAEFVFTYPDAGMMQLNARYNIRDENDNPTGVYMQGSSSFVVRPLGFYLNVVDNEAATGAGGNAYKKAGEDFTIELTAVQWQENNDDSDSDGVPDSNDTISVNPAAVNFGQESIAENAKLTHYLVLPDPTLGAQGILSDDDFVSFNNGETTLTLNYSEVGIIELFVNISDDLSYLGFDDVTGYVDFVGRFYPDHFELGDVLDGDIRSVCQATALPQTYAYIGAMDDAIPALGALRYGAEPEFTITAKSSICPLGVCSTTTNYTGDFAKLVEANLIRVEPTEDGTKDGADVVNKVKLTAEIIAGDLTEQTEYSGILSYVYKDEDHYVYTHEANSQVLPFVSDINLEVTSIIDIDGASALDFDSNDDLLFTGVLTLHPVGTSMRFGRWVMQNAYGPETSDLPMKHFIEQYNGTSFEVNTDETCIVPAITAKKITGAIHSGSLALYDYRLVDLDISDDLLTTLTDASVDSTSFIQGEFNAFTFSAPGLNKQGPLAVEYEVPSWFKFDWDNADGLFDGPYILNPTAVVTFGRYRGNDRVIYWREK